MKKKGMIVLAAVLVVLCILASILSEQFKPETVEGSKSFTVVVVHSDQTEKEYSYTTEAEYLGEVLMDEGLIAGEEGSYGLYVKTVDGETVDDSKQQWWCLTENGESLNTGVDSTPVEDGDQFELTMIEGY